MDIRDFDKEKLFYFPKQLVICLTILQGSY